LSIPREREDEFTLDLATGGQKVESAEAVEGVLDVCDIPSDNRGQHPGAYRDITRGAPD
jgi:hypothetical protein